MVTGTGRKPDVPRSPVKMARFNGEIMDLFSSRSPREEKEVSLLGRSSKICSRFEFRRKKRHSCCDWSRTPTDRSDQPSLRPMKGVTVVTQKSQKTVKRQTDTKTHWNRLQVRLFYSFHLRKSKV